MHVHSRIRCTLRLLRWHIPVSAEPFPVPLFSLRYQISPLLCIFLLAVIISMAPGQRCQGPSAVWPPRTAARPVKMQVYHTRTPSVTHTSHVAVYKILSGKFTVAMFSATGLCCSFRKTSKNLSFTAAATASSKKNLSFSSKHAVTYIYPALDDFASFMINSSILVEWSIAAVKPRNVWVQALRHAAQLDVPFHSAKPFKGKKVHKSLPQSST